MSVKDFINSQAEQNRINISKAQFDIYNDDLEAHVRSYLKNFYSERTIKDVPLLTCVNLAKRIVDTEASIYKKKPIRKFVNVTKAQEEQLNALYDTISIDDIMAEANRYYKLQGITHLFIKADENRLAVLPLKAHQLHVVTHEYEPWVAKSYLMRYKSGWIEYSPLFTKIYDAEGNLLSSIDYDEPVMLPIVSVKKPFNDTYWPKGGLSVTDFTIQFNALLSDIANIVRMQGFAQAYLKGPRNMLPESIKIGPNSILLLPVDPNNPVETQFGFASPNPDLSGSLEFLRSTLSAFLTSRGINPKAINTQGVGGDYASGIDRLLAMIDRFEATESDFSVFQKAEKELFKLILEYGSQFGLITGPISNDASVTVTFSKPESVMTESEKLDLIIKEKEAGLITDIEAIMRYRGVTESEAKTIYERVINAGVTNVV